MLPRFKLIEWAGEDGSSPIGDFLDSLDGSIRPRVYARLTRLAAGNLGDHRNLTEGLSELKMDFGGGLRIYFCREGDEIILLLAGGNKSSQQDDIEAAYVRMRQWRLKND